MSPDAAHLEGSSDAVEGLPFLRRVGAIEQRLVVLMGARLVLALVSLGIAFALDAAIGDFTVSDRWGLYGTVAFAFLATVGYGLLLPRVRNQRRFAALNIGADIAIVSSLVHFSGGSDSVFAFLYVLVATYGAVLFDRRGALAAACFGVLAYGGVLLLGASGASPSGRSEPAAVLFTIWSVHAGAMVLVAALASFLSVELRRTGEALRQRTSDLNRLASLHQHTVESLMSGLLTTDLRGRITSFNPEAVRITGLTAASALGRPIEEVLPGVSELIRASARSSGQTRTRIPYRNRDRQVVHLGVGAYVLYDAGEEVGGHVVIFQDVTDVVEMEAELRRSERLAAVGSLSASIAHEIRNPLAAISGSIQILRCGAESDQREGRRLMDIVVRETDRLNVLITDFLRYARPGPLHIESVPLADAVSEMLKMFEAALPEGVAVRVDVPAELAVEADPDQLRQVLWNLAVNAAQAMPDGGTLWIGASEEPRDASQEARSGRRKGVGGKHAWVEIAVRDQGIGIPTETLDHIFDPFFTTKPEGTGLGLATVHRIVDEHGGSIKLESSVNRGTEIRIRLPRSEVSA